MVSTGLYIDCMLGPTPKVNPKLLQPCPAEAVNTEDGDHSSGKGRAQYQGIITRIPGTRKCETGDAKYSDEDATSGSGLDDAAWRQHQQPHGEAEAAE